MTTPAGAGDPSYGLQLALVAHLRADDEIYALVGERIYDRFPTRAIYPAISVGGDQVVELDEDTLITEASETAMQIQVFSRDEPDPTYATVKRIAGLIRKALRRWTPVIDEHQVDGTEYRDTFYFRDDGLTSRAVMTFRVTSQADD